MPNLWQLHYSFSFSYTPGCVRTEEGLILYDVHPADKILRTFALMWIMNFILISIHLRITACCMYRDQTCHFWAHQTWMPSCTVRYPTRGYTIRRSCWLLRTILIQTWLRQGQRRTQNGGCVMGMGLGGGWRWWGHWGERAVVVLHASSQCHDELMKLLIMWKHLM